MPILIPPVIVGVEEGEAAVMGDDAAVRVAEIPFGFIR
jgi:hypothetical protein